MTQKEIGLTFMMARKCSYITRNELAVFLHITYDELVAYESGRVEIPLRVLKQLFIFGFLMMRVRYLHQRFVFFGKRLRMAGLMKDMPQNFTFTD